MSRQPRGGSYRVPARWGLVAVLSCVAALPLVVPAQAQESGCYTQVARVALHDDSGFLNIPASINGHTTRMIVDTGSEGSLLSPEAAALFETQRDKAVRTVVQGTGGVGHIVPNAIVTSFRVGKAQLGPVSVPVSALPATPRTEPAVEGLIGGDMLSGYDVEFNGAQGWLALWRAGQQQEAVKWYAAAVRTEPTQWNDSSRYPQLLPAWRDDERASLAEVQQAWASAPPAWP